MTASTTYSLKTDDYYLSKATEAIEAAVADAKDRGLSAQETRFFIRRAYPFSLPRKGKEYKLWNRLVLEKEREFGLEVRKHKDSGEGATVMLNKK